MEDINKGKCHSERYERDYSLWGTNKRPDFDIMFKFLLRNNINENREIYTAKAKLIWFSLTTYIQVLKATSLLYRLIELQWTRHKLI